MENSNGSSISSSFYNRGHNPSHPRNPFQFMFQSYSDSISSSSTLESSLFKNPAQEHEMHHRAASDGCLSDIEQPSWLEELLKEPDSPAVYKSCHRRSSSDSAAPLNITTFSGLLSSTNDRITAEISEPPSYVQKSGGNMNSKANIKKNQDQSSNAKADGSNTTASSKTESKRAKQRFGRNSRLRKLQYIAELERSVQFLQAKGFETLAAIRHHNEEILILGMENQALRQCLDNLSQEQRLKYMEQDMLKREIARLQILYQQQQQRQEQKHYLHQSKTKETELDLANLCI